MTGPRAYYNEHDPKAAAWLRQLIAEGHIAPGVVDERSIADVRAADLVGYTQCHFFAGIGVWSAALRGAGWPDDRPVWTGSCPCQPFSDAGAGAGFADERHLWPEFFRLIAERRPPVVFGEQVASKAGLQWLDLVYADLEGAGYACGAADLCAAGLGAPHIRQRLYWVADDQRDGRGGLASARLHERRDGTGGDEPAARDADRARGHDDDGRGAPSELGNPERTGLEGHGGDGDDRHEPGRLGTLPGGPAPAAGAAGDVGDPARGGCGVGGDAALARCGGHPDGAGIAGGLGDASGRGCDGGSAAGRRRSGGRAGAGDAGEVHSGRPGPVNGHWGAADWLLCRDGRWRPVEPGTFPLAHGAPARVGRLRGYGNAINLEVAEAFIEAYQDARAELNGVTAT